MKQLTIVTPLGTFEGKPQSDTDIDVTMGRRTTFDTYLAQVGGCTVIPVGIAKDSIFVVKDVGESNLVFVKDAE